MVFSIPALAASASAGSKPASSERIIRVLTGDGCTELTRTPCLAASSAATLVMPTSACLEVTYGSTPAEPSRPATDEVLTTMPAPALRMGPGGMVFSSPVLAASPSAGSKPASSERIIRVLTGDGCTELTRTPCLAASSAATLVMPTSACLEVTYGSTPAEPSRPATDEVLTTLPAPALYIFGRTCFRPR